VTGADQHKITQAKPDKIRGALSADAIAVAEGLWFSGNFRDL
jgi:hypothetical protein